MDSTANGSIQAKAKDAAYEAELEDAAYEIELKDAASESADLKIEVLSSCMASCALFVSYILILFRKLYNTYEKGRLVTSRADPYRLRMRPMRMRRRL